MTARAGIALWLLLAAPALPAHGQTLRVVVAGRRIDHQVSKARGYPAYPVTVLRTLGGAIPPLRGDTLTILLFGDTLLFRPAFAEFRANGAAVPLTDYTFLSRGTLHLPIRFFSHWLPSRYPERVRFEGGTLAVLEPPRVATRAASSGTAPATPSSRATAPPGGGLPRPERNPPGRPAADSAAPGPRRAAPEARDPDDLLPGILRGFIDSRVTGVFDSNIDHELVPRASYGTVGRLGLGMQSARSDPVLAVRYDFALHRFANSERWNRATHDVRAEVAPHFSVFRLRVRGEVRVGSWTEDRELANQLGLESGLEIRPSRAVVIALFGQHRVRRITGVVERVDTNRIVGASLSRRWRGGGRWRATGRYEDNHSERPASRYAGWSAAALLRVPLTSTDRLAVELEHRTRRFPERPVASEAGTTPRVDRRWTPELSLTHEFAGGFWSLELAYTFEHNGSNEADAGYLAHRMELGVRRRW